MGKRFFIAVCLVLVYVLVCGIQSAYAQAAPPLHYSAQVQQEQQQQQQGLNTFVNEEETIKNSKLWQTPLILQDELEEDKCTGFKAWLNKIFGLFACDSEQYQNITMPSALGIQGQGEESQVEGVATISALISEVSTQEGEVKGIATFFDNLRHAFDMLGSPEEGALNKYYTESQKSEMAQSGQPANDIPKVIKQTQCMNLPLGLQASSGCLAQATDENPSPDDSQPPETEVPGNGVQPPPDAPYSGTCSFGSGYCAVSELQKKYFPKLGAAQRASIICQRESGSNPFSNNKSCQTAKTVDRTVDYSIGLFQINLLAHCPGAFSYTWEPPSCRILDQNKVNACESNMLDPDKNLQEAVRISNNGTNWRGPWSAARVCNIPDGDGPLEQPVPRSAQQIPDLLPDAQVAGCPAPSQRIQAPGVVYQHLDQQLACIKPSMIVIHWSGAWTTAEATFNTLNSRNLSCQFAIDRNSNMQMLSLYPDVVQKGYCIGNQFNDQAINFEISGVYFDEVIGQYTRSPQDLTSNHYRFEDLKIKTDKSVQLVCWLLKQYTISKTEIYGHYQLRTGKSDPGIEYLKYFKDRVQNECQ